MSRHNQKPRIVVKPFVPRKVPYQIPIQKIDEFIKKEHQKIKKVLFVGWARRKIDGKRKLLFLAATGETTTTARKNFKESYNFGDEVWVI